MILAFGLSIVGLLCAGFLSLARSHS